MKMRRMTLILLTLCSTTLLFAGAKKPTEKRVEELLSKMTLKEKIGQMNQVNYYVHLNDDEDAQKEMYQNPVKAGEIGSILNLPDAETVNRIQKIAVEESRLGIPLIVGRDVIHGFKTIFPIPLGQAASFNPQIAEKGAKIAAREARSTGVNWTFAPMMDISRDGRWGRIAESMGEDPYLAGEFAAAMVRGFQGNGNLSDPDVVAACAKHFVGYGASESGLDYNSTKITPTDLRNIYLYPFKKAVEAGVYTVMTSFNENDGVPMSGNSEVLRDLLRDDLGFEGFVISDWDSQGMMMVQGYAKDREHVAEISAFAGVDMEMESRTYIDHLEKLVEEGVVPVSYVDNAVRNILRVKFELGLFENPYVDTTRPSTFYAEEHLKEAREAAVQSAVLLKNNGVLPISEKARVAIIGPLADAPHDQMGTWCFDGESEHTVTPVGALRGEYSHIDYVYEPVLEFSRDKNKSNFEKAVKAAKGADVAVLFVGEESILSGEGASLADINLIGVQSELLEAVKATGTPVVAVVMAGRPLTIGKELECVDAMLYNFHPGTMGGPAILDLLFGRRNPSGKLPTTFLQHVGQSPMYYNHISPGRPAPAEYETIHDIDQKTEQSSLGYSAYYLDVGHEPLLPFGYGLSYSNFDYSDIKLSTETMVMDGELKVSATVTNSSDVEGVEVVQLYIRDLVGSIARPVKELKRFERVLLKGGESKVVEFTLTADDLSFYGRDLVRKAEEGEFHVWIGGDSNAKLRAEFRLEN